MEHKNRVEALTIIIFKPRDVGEEQFFLQALKLSEY